MATKNKTSAATAEVVQQKYKGSQLLKLDKYNDRVARIVIKPNELYSYEDADKLIFNFMKKKG